MSANAVFNLPLLSSTTTDCIVRRCSLLHYSEFLVCFTDTLIFDNSFSWTRSKTIYYNTEVLCEDEALITTEINSLIEQGDWGTLSRKFETTHL